MRRPTGRGYCSACNVSAGSAHRSTRSHQDRVFRLNHPRVKLERAKRRQYAEQYSLKGKVRVRKHRRRPPLDGKVKTVHVKR